MRLARLLAAGRSVVGVKDHESPYRVTEERLLPRFGLETGPAFSTVKPGSVVVAGGEAPAIDPVAGESSSPPDRETRVEGPSHANGAERPSGQAGAGHSSQGSAQGPAAKIFLPRLAAPPEPRSRLGRAAKWLKGKLGRFSWRAGGGPA